MPHKHSLKMLCKSKHFQGDIEEFEENINGCFFSQHGVHRWRNAVSVTGGCAKPPANTTSSPLFRTRNNSECKKPDDYNYA